MTLQTLKNVSLTSKTTTFLSVENLTKIRNDRLAQLLKEKSTKTLYQVVTASSAPPPPPPPPHKHHQKGIADLIPHDDDNISKILLSQSAALADENERWNMESLYRMAGVTTFTVQDPSAGNEKLMGIRIEMFIDGSLFFSPVPIIIVYSITSQPFPISLVGKM